ncbi:hypothetical protein SODG_004507 [Sodalis praecaptivus]|nr:hypothetical protein NVIRENTERO_01196 [Sodalis praecaptivus]
MRPRCSAAAAYAADRKKVLKELLRLKARREARLRRLLAQVSRDERQNEANAREGDAQLARLARTRHAMLSWRGRATVGDMGRRAREMQGVLRGVYALNEERCRLRQTRALLEKRRRALQQERVTIMKQQEKLTLVLTDDDYQN